jgi:DNA-binding XRE family transcriptional regulator
MSDNPTTPPPGFPRRLRKLRVQHGYTQKALAEIANVHWRTIGHWETGLHKPVPGDGIIRTAVALNTTVKFLLEGKR